MDVLNESNRQNFKVSENIIPTGEFISDSNIFKAEIILLRIVQNIHFESDIRLLDKHQECSGRVRKLRLFLQEEVLRMSGRLQNANFKFGISLFFRLMMI